MGNSIYKTPKQRKSLYTGLGVVAQIKLAEKNRVYPRLTKEVIGNWSIKYINKNGKNK